MGLRGNSNARAGPEAKCFGVVGRRVRGRTPDKASDCRPTAPKGICQNGEFIMLNT